MSVKTFVLLVGAALAIFAQGCSPRGQGADDPKRRLTDYVQKTFNVKDVQDRETLAGYMIGDARSRLSSWSDEQFRQAFIDARRTFVRLLVSEIKSVSGKEVNITYELTYLDQNRGKDAKVTNKKLAQMVQDNGKWFISEVRNIKETVEYRNEMTF